MKKSLILLAMLFLGLPLLVGAETKTFLERYEYKAGEADSKLTCRAISLMEAKKLLLERLGTFIKSETKMVDFQITKDEVTSLSAGIVKTDIVEEQWDGSTYVLTARIQADPEKVADEIKALSDNHSETQKIRKFEDVTRQSQEKIIDLRNELAQAQIQLIQMNRDFSQSSKIVTAWDAFDRGVDAALKENYSSAVAAFDEVIDLNPSYLAYFNRGKAHYKLKKYSKAISDFSKSIELNPAMHGSYFNRGLSRLEFGQSKQGMEDIRNAARMGNEPAKRFLKMKQKRY